MNNGLQPGPARRLDPAAPRLRAALFLIGSSPTAAGADYPRASMKGAYNIRRVIYNATGDFTVVFSEAMPHKNFVVTAMAKGIVMHVHASDTGVNDRKRFLTYSVSSGAANATEIHIAVFA